MTAKSFDEHLDLKVSANSTISEIRAAVEYLVDYEVRIKLRLKTLNLVNMEPSLWRGEWIAFIFMA